MPNAWSLPGGPSPRVRGKPPPTGSCPSCRGSIPARAGETYHGRCRQFPPNRVHPRACGGNGTKVLRGAVVEGPSPRVRGKHRNVQRLVGDSGSIPARAGETGALRAGGSRTGSIPARAGETSARSTGCGTRPVHPRACGGNATTSAVDRRRVHPRACGGNPSGAATRSLAVGSIPARAGETPARSAVDRGVHPRASPASIGSIPARAGETPYVRAGRRVHPRACGGPQRGTAGRVHPRACGGNPYCHRKFTIPSSSSENTRQTLIARF